MSQENDTTPNGDVQTPTFLDRLGMALLREPGTRQQLIEIFPTWDRDRTEQHITLHMGPTNSGKTFSGLNNLAAAGSGGAHVGQLLVGAAHGGERDA